MQAPDDFARWGLHCFCLGARRTPQGLVREGDTGRRLYQARRPVAAAALGNAERVADLAAFGLIRPAAGGWTIAFPAIGPREAAVLRARVAALAEEVAAASSRPLAEVVRGLDDAGLGASRFAVVFGHVLDGLFWEVLAARGALPETELDAAHPWWRGAFWAVWPPRSGAAGVNMRAAGGARLMQVWTEATAPALRAFAALPEVDAGLGQAGDAGPTLRVGGVDLPVIRDDPAAPAAAAAEVIVARFLPEAAALCEDVLPPETDIRVGTVIAGHELIWTLADRLAAEAGLVPPRDPAAAMFVRLTGPG